MSSFEILPLRSELYVPENKVSAWVSKNGANVARDGSKEHQGVWVVDEYTLDRKKASTEVWIFYDNDELGIDRRVLENNPLQGTWGYAPGVEARKARVQDMWFFPPKSAKCKIPSNREEYNHRGTWVKPVFKRDLSQLGPDKSGFINVSGNMRIAKGEKYSVAGKWNMLGFNDDVVRGRKKEKKDDSVEKGPWEIHVRKPNGTRFPLYVIPGNKISDCKNKINAKKGIPVEDQRLSFDTIPLKDEKTLVGSGIRNGDTIDLDPMIIHVRTRKGKKFTFEVDNDEMVENVKKLVEKYEGTPVEEQRLYFKYAKLEDGKTLSDFNVSHNSTLDLGAMIIYVQPNGRKPKLELDVEPTDTLKSVKTKVKNRLQIPVSDQRLSFQDMEMLSNSKDLKSYDVHHLDTLFMLDGNTTKNKNSGDKPSMIIFVVKEWNNDKFKLRTEPTNTIEDVKKMIEASENIPVDQQRLTFQRKSLYNSKTLEQSKIKNKSILHLGAPKDTKTHLSLSEPLVFDDRDPINFEVKTPDGRSFIFDFDPTYEDLKDLEKKIAKTVGLPVKDLHLYDSNGDLIDENNLPLRGDILDVDIPQIEIVLPDRSKVKLCVLPAMTMDDLKDMVEETTGTPKVQQRIFFFDDDDENELDGDIDVGKLGIGPGSVLEMRTPAPEDDKITVRLPDGRTFVFDFDPTYEDLKDLEKKIAKTVGLPIKDLPLYDSNDDLIDENNLPSRGDILDVDIPQIEIVLPDRSKVKLCVLPAMTMDDLKDMVEETTGTPKVQQRIFFFDDDDESELDDDIDVGKLGIGPGSVLEMRTPAPEDDKITVRLPDGRSFVFDFDPTSDNWDDVKTKISSALGVRPADLPPLMLNDVELDDNNYHPSRGDILDFVPTEIEVELPDRGRVLLSILPIQTIGDIKDIVEEQTGVNRCDQRIFYFDNASDEIEDDIVLSKAKIQPGTLLKISCPPDRKKIIEKEASELSISDKNQRKFFFDESQELEDDTHFEKLNFDRGQTLEMRSIIINVQDGKGMHFELDVQSDWYIDDVRDQIHRLTNIAPEQQNFLFNGKPVVEDLNLIKQGIVHDSILFLEPMSIYVNIPFRKKPVQFVVERIDTVDVVRRRALKKLKKGKIHASRNYSLVLGGRELGNDKTLEKCHVQHKDILTLEEFKLRVMHWCGDIIDLVGVGRNSTVSFVKKRIHESVGISMKDQALSLEGRRLNDKNTLEEESVKHRAMLILEGPDTDTEIARAEKRNVKMSKVKKFRSTDDCDEILPVMPDWKRRIFFFDSENTIDAHIELVIMHWAGEKFTLENILLSQKVGEVKSLIFKVKGIRKEKQILKFDGKVLKDKMTLLKQNIRHRSIIVMEPPKGNAIATPGVERLNGIFSTLPTKLVTNIHIKVSDWKGDTFDLSVAPNDYIDDVKDLLYDLKNIPLEQLRLLFRGQPTEDDMNLEEHGIVDGSTLFLEPMRILLHFPKDEEVISLDVEMNQRIYDIKKNASKASGLPFESLCFMLGGSELENSKTLLDCGVEHEDEIRVEIFEIKIMHWSGEIFSVIDVGPNGTTYDVKTRIFAKLSIPVEEQTLVLKGRVLNDFVRLKDQDVHHRAVLIMDGSEAKILSPLRQKVKFDFFKHSRASEYRKDKTSGSAISIKIQHWNGELFCVDVEPTEYVDDLRERIFSERNIPVDQQRLEFRGRLVSEDTTVSEQGIADNSTIFIRKMKIFIHVPYEGVNIEVEVAPEDSILQVKKRFKKKSKLPTKGHCLVLTGETLSDGKKVSQYKIEDGEVLLLEAFKVKVLDWNGKFFEADGIHHDSTVAELKKRIKKLRSIPLKEQVLKLNGLPVIDSLRLQDQGIDHRTIVVLETASKRPRNVKPHKSSKVALVPESSQNNMRFQELREGRDIYSAGDKNPPLRSRSTSTRSSIANSSLTNSSSTGCSLSSYLERHNKSSEKKKKKKKKKKEKEKDKSLKSKKDKSLKSKKKDKSLKSKKYKKEGDEKTIKKGGKEEQQ